MEELIKAVFLGIVQGLTEFLPISSTGHLLVFRKLFGLSEAGLFFDTMMHVGTFVSVVIVFWDEIVYLIRHPFSKLSMLIVIGTIPTALIGLSFEDFFEEISKTGSTVGWEFIATGIILWLADKAKHNSYKEMGDIRFKDAILVGTLQGAAILPAISRSGLTIAGALFSGIEKNTAARFSFLISLPAILGGVVLQGLKIGTGEEIIALQKIGIIPIIVGTLAASISGFIAVKWMLKLLQSGSLRVFSYYVWFLGGSIILSQVLGLW